MAQKSEVLIKKLEGLYADRSVGQHFDGSDVDRGIVDIKVPTC